MAIVVSFLADEKVYLFVKENVVNDFETVSRALTYFEKAYNNNHSRGHEASMSALINGITFQPSVHEWDHQDLSPMIDMEIIENGTFHAYSLSHVSGGMVGALCTGERALEWHESGLKPRLIS
jgi:hypothetical protein